MGGRDTPEGCCIWWDRCSFEGRGWLVATRLWGDWLAGPASGLGPERLAVIRTVRGRLEAEEVGGGVTRVLIGDRVCDEGWVVSKLVWEGGSG